MSRRKFVLSIDVENSSFSEAQVTDHKFQRDEEQDSAVTCICGEPESEHDDDYDRIREVARILSDTGERMALNLATDMILRDSNGQKVGRAHFVEVSEG